MYLTKKKTTLIAIFIILAILIGTISLTQAKASAATIESYDDLDFNLISNADGSQSYSVALKAAYRPTAEFIVVPDTYNGLPVTEVADNGFISCAKLSKVFLSRNVVAIGRNAFMNCTSMEHISMPCVVSIEDNAFAMCKKLERLYFPLSVKSVGATILRNNPNTVYIQGSMAEVNTQWSSTWNSYFTGEIIYNVDPAGMIQYREILGADNQTVIGYELADQQHLSGEDVVIYNTFRPDANSEYLPVLNICSDAFTMSDLNSLTIKDRHEDDPSVPKSTHKINIRSNAFEFSFIKEINILVGVTFNHTQGLQQALNESIMNGVPFTGDAEGHSVNVFQDSSVESITLPSDMDIITEDMFKNCSFLEEIKIYGNNYNGKNVLPQVVSIGSCAFENCIGLNNLSIPNSVTYLGHNVFSGWGINTPGQEINLDFFEGYVPGEADWNVGIEKSAVRINYKEPTTIYINLQDGSGRSIPIQVKAGLEMPKLDAITRRGYNFKGIFSDGNGSGYQYYTDGMQVARQWEEGDPTILYVNWEAIEYRIEYNYSEIPFNVEKPTNPTKYTVEDGEIIFNEPYLEGYEFWWEPARKPKDVLEEIFRTSLYCRPEKYKITYEVDGGLNSNDNPSSIDMTEIVRLSEPTKNGYVFIGWQLNGVYVTTLQNINGPITLVAIWEPLGAGTTQTPETQVTTVNSKRVIINLTNASYISGCKLIVENTVEELVIYSNTPINYNMSVVVNTRSTSIFIKLINVSLHGTGDCDTITVESQVTLNLYAVNSAIYGQEGYRGTNGDNGTSPTFIGLDGNIGGTGYAAIKCFNLVIHTDVTIYGGTGGTGGAGGAGNTPGKGGAGGVGGYAVDAQEIGVCADNVKLVGGDGGTGGRGSKNSAGTVFSDGGVGGMGSIATNATITGDCAPELVEGQKGQNGPHGSTGSIIFKDDEPEII